MARRHLPEYVKAIGLIALGGILGSNLRFFLGAVGGKELFITMLVNGAGSFGLGLLLFDLRADNYLSKRFRYLFGIGFFASFTSYSTFIADIFSTGNTTAVAYVAASYAASIGGILLSRYLLDTYSVNGVTDVSTGGD